MAETRIGFWDVELTPLEVATWSLWPTAIPISHIRKPQRVLCFAWRWYGEKRTRFYSEWDLGAEGIVSQLHALHEEADALVSWNGAGFDTRHANTAIVKDGLLPASESKEIDLMRVVKRRFKFASNKLDWVSQELGVGRKVEHGGLIELEDAAIAGDEKARRTLKKYNIQDVDLLVELYEKLKPWIPNSMHPNMGLDQDAVCPKCASRDLERRGWARTTAGRYQRYQCRACGSWTRYKTLVPGNEMR